MLARKYADLFRLTNYKFSTLEGGGARKSSLYFQDVAGNQGRWRREHRDGELLVYQGKSLRIFVSSAEAGDYLDAAEDEPMLAKQLWMRVRDGERIDGYSGAAVDGYHVVELVPPTYFQGHGSSGVVKLNDPTAGAAAYAGLANYAGNISDWTMIAAG